MSCRIIVTCGCLFALTACGSSKGVSIDRDYVETKVNAFEATVEQLDDLSPTKFDAMPKSGGATFKGPGGFYIENKVGTDADDLNFIGDAKLTADFARGTVAGDITNIFGLVGDNEKTGRIIDVDGDIDLGGRGSSIGRGAPNNFATTYDGTLKTDTEGTIVLRGTADGKFIGTRAAQSGTPDAIRGIAALDENAGITRNGKKVDGELLIIGEN
ncbi:hypothetical protein [Loktanella sp. SALINAS62]|uniref:hypothetical protein n=1 Tax=Loktanella sp. SALINAS62 TaxID=2706124 RepID=UPI001B8AC5CE|nr:hypothetical protein [Loktanella sp. SALINAS62]MBS1304245.1 transferrin-binding protein-like solute binding protein [Loktanella sp. SALINAS62]